jgi:hypothetical protein
MPSILLCIRIPVPTCWLGIQREVLSQQITPTAPKPLVMICYSLSQDIQPSALSSSNTADGSRGFQQPFDGPVGTTSGHCTTTCVI